jgi:phage replication-related protein YjqB (UPF0714/DUF867 family)
MAVPYEDYTELVLKALKDRDYRLNLTDREADVTVTAIHGGGIEPLTSELAAAIAGEEHNLYDFRGIRPQGNEELRIPAHRFDEMHLRQLLRRSRLALSVLGVEGAEALVHLGGRNRRLVRILRQRLTEAGFVVRGPLGPGAAHGPTRFVNWPAEGGVQMELTRALRQKMVDGPLADFLWEDARRWNDLFCAFIVTVRGALMEYNAQVRSDLDVALGGFEEATPEVRRTLGLHESDGDNGDSSPHSE